MTTDSNHYDKEYHDYTTSSVAGLLTLFIILVGNVLVAAWFFYFY
jgi:hypothetical protein